MKQLLPLTARLVRDDSAIVSILVAATMMMSIAMAGFGVDFGRAEFAKVELQSALDAGGLAGGGSFNTTSTVMTTIAQQYFGANWGDPFTSALTNGSPIYTPNADLNQMSGFASISVPTTMLWAIGQKNMLAQATDNVITPAESGGLELVMVIDNTGSEAQGCKMNYLVAAAQGMINQLYGVANPTTTNVAAPPSSSSCSSSYTYTIPTYTPPADVTNPGYFWVTLVPFVTEVAPVAYSTSSTSDMQEWITKGWIDTMHASEFPASSPWGSNAGTGLTTPGGGCVEARLYTAPGDTTKDPYGGEDPVTTSATPNTSWNGAAFNDTFYGVELSPSQAPFTRYFFPSDTDHAPDPNNPYWVAGNADLQPIYSANATGTETPANVAVDNGGFLKNISPAFTATAVVTATADLGVTGENNTSPLGSPNAPYWPAFNNWANSTVGAAPSFNDKNNTAALEQILATNRPGSGGVISTNDTSSTYTLPSGTGDGTYPVFDTSVPSNFTYVLGPNLGCPAPMTVFSTDYTTIMTNLAAMFPMMAGGTATNTGLAWGFRALSPNWQGVWNEGASTVTGNQSLTLPLPYNDIVTTSGGARIAMQKVVIFMTDGNNQWGLTNLSTGANLGGNTYTAYKTLDHTPLLDQTPAWTHVSNVAGQSIPAPQSSTSNMVTRANEAVDVPANFGGVSYGGDGIATGWTTEAWALCQAMQTDGVIMYTILLEYNTSDISTEASDGYKQNCSTDPQAGTHFYELTGANVSELGSVFTAIGNDLSALRLAQ
jgi:hypothetical protein